MKPTLKLIRVVKGVAHRLGVDVMRYPNQGSDPIVRYAQLMGHTKVSLVVDVGANSGQFAGHLRHVGWKGRIVSYEPLSSAFEALQRRSQKDTCWSVYNCAIGSKATRGTLHVAENSQSSSLLPMLDRHMLAAPESRYIKEESVAIVTLDSALAGIVTPADNLCIKIDCQGYERNVLDGASISLDRTVMIVMELSFVELYEGSMLFDDAIHRLSCAGFGLAALDPAFTDPDSKELLQADGCFIRRPAGGPTPDPSAYRADVSAQLSRVVGTERLHPPPSNVEIGLDTTNAFPASAVPDLPAPPHTHWRP